MTHAALNIVGIELRTNNIEAFETIPPFWGKFFSLGGSGAIDARLSNTVYAVYTNFEHPGVDNLGQYSLIIGCAVPDDTPIPEGFVSCTMSPQERKIFPVEIGHPEKVGEKWMEIWQDNTFKKSYLCDYEEYKENGEINIHVGVKTK